MHPNMERFGVFLPSYVWPDDGRERAKGITQFSRRVEELGFDSLFITDHMLAAQDFYSVNFLEPLATLAVAAGATERVRLGTSILILPLRTPVLLAKQAATLQYLSGDRLVLGVGIGWYEPEFASVGVDKVDRGSRTDEVLEICRRLWAGGPVTYSGRHYQLDEVEIEPRSERPPTLWVGGGSQLADPNSPDLPRFAEPVKARAARADGWIPRPTCPPEGIAGDWDELQETLVASGRDLADYTVAHENFMHFVDTRDRDLALRRQHEAFDAIMSPKRGPGYLEQVYLFGTPDDLVDSLQQRIDAGVDYFMLHTMTPDAEQLVQWRDQVVPNVTFPADRVTRAAG